MNLTSADKKWNILAIEVFALGVSAFMLHFQNLNTEWWIDGIWCIGGALILLPYTLRIIIKSPISFLKDHRLVTTIAFIFYFLLGSSFVTFGSEESISLAQEGYPLTITEALKIDSINAIGFSITIFIFNFSKINFYIRTVLINISKKTIAIDKNKVTNFLFFLGLIGYLGVVYNNLRGGEQAMNAILPTLDKFNLILIYLYQTKTGKNANSQHIMSVILLILQIFSGLIILSKAGIFLPILIFIFSLCIRLKYKFIKIMVIGFLFFFIIQAASAVITATRLAIGADINTMSFVDRVQSVYNRTSSAEINASEYSLWSRISYITLDGAAVRYYDDGLGGDEMRLIPWLFLPRVLFPNKPIISNLGSEFYTKLTGNEGSSIGFGIFVDGYYNKGWLGVFLFSSLYGWILRQTSSISEHIINNDIQLIYPLSLFGVIMGYRIDGKFIVDQLGIFIILIYILIAIDLLTISFPKSKKGLL